MNTLLLIAGQAANRRPRNTIAPGCAKCTVNAAAVSTRIGRGSVVDVNIFGGQQEIAPCRPDAGSDHRARGREPHDRGDIVLARLGAASQRQHQRVLVKRAHIAGLAARGSHHVAAGAKLQQPLIEAAHPGVRLALYLVPAQAAAQERLGTLRIRNRRAADRVGERRERAELLTPPLGDLVPELLAVIGEEQERRRGRPLLTHEQQRRVRHEQQQRAERAERRRVHLVVQPRAVRAVADLIVVLDAHHELLRRERGRVGPARLAEVVECWPLKNQPWRSVAARSSAVPVKSA